MRQTDGAASAVMQVLYWTFVVKKEQRWNVKLLIYLLIYIPALICGHELWTVTETTLWKQTACSCLLRRVAGFRLRDL